MTLVCPECKNRVDLSKYGDIKRDTVVECQMCGITLLVTVVDEDGTVTAEIMEEGK